jgi:tripartite-type tricarboxylate transporter receptor subunit TctC
MNGAQALLEMPLAADQGGRRQAGLSNRRKTGGFMRVLLGAMALVFVLAGGPVAAQSWPSRPVSVVVGFPAGAGIDSFARLLADGLRERTGQPFIVENRPGAAGNLAAQAVARAAPDGYTVLYTPNSTHAANIHLYKNLGFDPIKDFTPVTTFVENGWFLVANAAIPVNSVAELTAYLKARPGTLAYGTSGASGTIAAELYRSMANFDAVNVPYKGVPPAVNDLLGGRLVFMFADISMGMSLSKSGKVKGLAVTTPRRIDLAPDVPTMAESGLPGYELVSWQAVFLPANAPKEIVQRLAELSNAVATSDKAREFLRRMAVNPRPGSPQVLARLVESETLKWGELIRAAGMKPE